MDEFIEEALKAGFTQAQAEFLNRWFLEEDEEYMDVDEDGE